jgi:outer membrane receptor protein involved in Fe transport
MPSTSLRSVILRVSCAALFAVVCLVSFVHAAEEAATKTFDLPVAPADKSLKLFSDQSGRGVVFMSDDVKKVQTNQVQGEMTPVEALIRLTAGTPLMVLQDVKTGAFSVRIESPKEAKNGSSRPASDRAAKMTTLGDAGDEITKMSPFIISVKNDGGYQAQQTLAGSRSAKTMLEIPADVKIINKQIIDDLNGTTPQDVIKFAAADVTPNFGFKDDFQFRGFRQNGALRNGVVNTPGNKQTPMYDVSRVEVITGPAAMLLGGTSGNSIGGVINLISIAPTANATGQIDATFGDKNYVRSQANLSGPAIDSKDVVINYRLTLGALNSDKEKNIEKLNQQFFGVGFTVLLGPNTRVEVSAYDFVNKDYQYYEDFLDISGPTPSLKALAKAKLNQYSTKSFSPFDRQHAKFDTNSSFVDVTFLTKLTENSDLRIYYAHSGLKDVDQYLSGATVQPDNYTLLRQVIPETDGRSYNYFQADFLSHIDFPFFKLENGIGVDGSKQRLISRLSVLTSANGVPALDTRHPDFGADSVFFGQPQPGLGLPNTINVETNNLNSSLYIQETASFWKDRIAVVGGLRWFSPWSERRDFIANTITPTVNHVALVHKYGAIVRPLPWISVYYTDAQNIFPQTGVTDLLVAGDGQGPPLQNQKGTNKEFGLKVDRALSEKVAIFGSIAHFDMGLTNIRIVSGTLANGNPGTTQDQKNTSSGWDAAFGARIKLATGTADLLVGAFNGQSHVAGAPYAIQAVGFSPRKYSLLAKYTWTSGPLEGFMIGGGASSRSTWRSSNYLIDAPVDITLFAGYEWNRRWSAQFNVTNLTNKRYITALASPALIETSEPFQPRLQVKYRW